MLKLVLFLGGFLLLTIGIGLLGTIPPKGLEKLPVQQAATEVSQPAS